MAFFPKVNDKIRIGSESYTFNEHPNAPGMPYGQAGRKGTVYQLKNSKNQLRALKVFASTYRSPNVNAQSTALARYAKLPGLLACRRIVLSRDNDPKLISSYPDFNYSVLMPWINGSTWQEYVMNRDPCSKMLSWKLATKLVEILAIMEKQRVAHCDLSGPNLIITDKSNGSNNNIQIALIDLEDLYAVDLKRPKKIPAGSAGYAHKSVRYGIWAEQADRFSGSIIISNMLAWSSPVIRELAFGEQYFDPNEMQLTCRREKTLYRVLEKEWSHDVAKLFAQAWQSDSLEHCPSFFDWSQVLNIKIHDIDIELDDKILKVPLSTSAVGPVAGWKSITNEKVNDEAIVGSLNVNQSKSLSDFEISTFHEYITLKNRENKKETDNQNKNETGRKKPPLKDSYSENQKNFDDFLTIEAIFAIVIIIMFILIFTAIIISQLIY